MISNYIINFDDIGNINLFHKYNYIESYIINNNIDILFIINYKNYTLDMDVDNYLDNVFYTTLENDYNIYKGELYNNICNAILIKKKFFNFSIIKKKYNEYNIQPLVLHNFYTNLTLVCVNEIKHNKNIYNKNNNFCNKNNTNTIIAGNFIKNKINKYDTKYDTKYDSKYDTKLIENKDYYSGIFFRKYYIKEFEITNSDIFNNIIKCNLLEEPNKYNCYFSNFWIF